MPFASLSQWKDVVVRNYDKSFDHRSGHFKQQDKKFCTSKQFITEIRDSESTPGHNLATGSTMGIPNNLFQHVAMVNPVNSGTPSSPGTFVGGATKAEAQGDIILFLPSQRREEFIVEQ